MQATFVLPRYQRFTQPNLRVPNPGSDLSFPYQASGCTEEMPDPTPTTMLEVEAGNKTGIYYITVSNVRPPRACGSEPSLLPEASGRRLLTLDAAAL